MSGVDLVVCVFFTKKHKKQKERKKGQKKKTFKTILEEEGKYGEKKEGS